MNKNYRSYIKLYRIVSNATYQDINDFWVLEQNYLSLFFREINIEILLNRLSLEYIG